MTNQQIISKFFNGNAREGKANNLTIVGDKLYNYDTVIAQRIDKGDRFIINVTQYSTTTSKIRNSILKFLPASAVVKVDNQKMGVQNLTL